MICNRFCHPFHGFQLPFLFLRGVPHPTLPRGVLHRLAMGMSPVSRALNAARLRLAKFQFIALIAQILRHDSPDFKVGTVFAIYADCSEIVFLAFGVLTTFLHTIIIIVTGGKASRVP